jgi:hypothetical protein
MHIEKEWAAPNGAQTTVHRINMIVIQEAQTIATVNSYAPAALSAAAESNTAPLIGWQDRIAIPDTAFTGNGPMQSVAEFLIGDDQYLAGGTIASDEAPTADAVAA